MLQRSELNGMLEYREGRLQCKVVSVPTCLGHPLGASREPRGLLGLIRPLKSLVRPLKGLIRPFKGLIRPFGGMLSAPGFIWLSKAVYGYMYNCVKMRVGGKKF